MILISVRQNKTNAAVIIEGPEGVLISKDENKPIITDNKPPIIDNLTICVGLLETFLAIAAGIINIPVINRRPTILIDIATVSYTHLTLPTNTTV